MTQPEDSLDRSIRYIRAWLRINAENQRAVKTLTDILEMLEWAKQTMDGLANTGAESEYLGTLHVKFDRMHDSLVGFLPPAPSVNLLGLERFASSATTSYSSGLLSVVGSGGVAGTVSWTQERVDSFRSIQERHHTIVKLRERICALQDKNPTPPDIVAEFDLMIDKAFYYRGSDLDKSITAGISIRLSKKPMRAWAGGRIVIAAVQRILDGGKQSAR